MPKLQARDEQHRQPRQSDHDRGAEIRLRDDQRAKESEHAHGRQRPLPEQLDAPAGAIEKDAQRENRHDLRQLARLQAQRSQNDPAVRTVDRAREQNRYQKREDDCEEGPRQELVVAPFVVVEPGHRNDHQYPDDKVLELAAHEEICVTAVVARRVHLACARENDKAQQHESRDYQAKREKCGLAHPAPYCCASAGSFMICPGTS